MIVRELIALFGIQLDAASVARADAGFQRVRHSVQQADAAVHVANGRLSAARGSLLSLGGQGAAAQLSGVAVAARGAAGEVGAISARARDASAGLDGLGRIVGGFALLAGLKSAAGGMIKLASDAVESNHVIGEVFGGQAGAGKLGAQCAREGYLLSYAKRGGDGAITWMQESGPLALLFGKVESWP